MTTFNDRVLSMQLTIDHFLGDTDWLHRASPPQSGSSRMSSPRLSSDEISSSSTDDTFEPPSPRRDDSVASYTSYDDEYFSDPDVIGEARIRTTVEAIEAAKRGRMLAIDVATEHTRKAKSDKRFSIKTFLKPYIKAEWVQPAISAHIACMWKITFEVNRLVVLHVGRVLTGVCDSPETRLGVMLGTINSRQLATERGNLLQHLVR